MIKDKLKERLSEMEKVENGMSDIGIKEMQSKAIKGILMDSLRWLYKPEILIFLLVISQVLVIGCIGISLRQVIATLLISAVILFILIPLFVTLKIQMTLDKLIETKEVLSAITPEFLERLEHLDKKLESSEAEKDKLEHVRLSIRQNLYDNKKLTKDLNIEIQNASTIEELDEIFKRVNI